MAVAPLRALHDAGHEVALVVSRPDARRGRRGHDAPSPVKAAALELGLPVTDDLRAVVDVGADLGVVAAYGRIIPVDVLEALPMVNLHYSLLPRWRGAAPVERAILAGDRETGVCLMAVEEGLDTGGVYARQVVPIDPHATADELRAALVEASTDVLLTTLAEGIGEAVPQTGEPTYADKIDVAELQLDWSCPADDLERKVRVGGAWTTVAGKRLKVWRGHATDRRGLAAGQVDEVGDIVVVGAAADTALELLEVQAEGKPRRAASAWVRGAHLGADARLGT